MKIEIEKAAEVIKNGGVILYPTDTIWGLGCDPTNEEAIEKLIRIKQRDTTKSFIVLVNNEALLQRYVKDIPDVCYDLIDYANRPLTIVYPTAQYLSEKVMGKDGSVAIRITADEFCKRLIQRCKCGLVSTSANISNQPYTNKLENLPKAITSEVDYIVNLPLKNNSGKSSQIIQIKQNGEVTIIRK